MIVAALHEHCSCLVLGNKFADKYNGTSGLYEYYNIQTLMYYWDDIPIGVNENSDFR